MIFRIYLFFGVVGALTMWWWARKHGKPPGRYMLLGALSGPILLLLYTVLRKTVRVFWGF